MTHPYTDESLCLEVAALVKKARERGLPDSTISSTLVAASVHIANVNSENRFVNMVIHSELRRHLRSHDLQFLFRYCGCKRLFESFKVETACISRLTFGKVFGMHREMLEDGLTHCKDKLLRDLEDDPKQWMEMFVLAKADVFEDHLLKAVGSKKTGTKTKNEMVRRVGHLCARFGHVENLRQCLLDAACHKDRSILPNAIVGGDWKCIRAASRYTQDCMGGIFEDEISSRICEILLCEWNASTMAHMTKVHLKNKTASPFTTPEALQQSIRTYEETKEKVTQMRQELVSDGGEVPVFLLTGNCFWNMLGYPTFDPDRPEDDRYSFLDGILAASGKKLTIGCEDGDLFTDFLQPVAVEQPKGLCALAFYLDCIYGNANCEDREGQGKKCILQLKESDAVWSLLVKRWIPHGFERPLCICIRHLSHILPEKRTTSAIYMKEIREACEQRSPPLDLGTWWSE